MKKNNSDNKLKRTRGDIGHALAKAGISSIPVLGGAAAELFSQILTPPLEKRRDELIQNIGKRLLALERNADGFKAEDLKDNDAFITTVMHASTIAMRTHQQEKLEALLNAITNAAFPRAPDEDLQIMFLSYVDAFTPYHLRILDFLHDPNDWNERNNARLPKFDEQRYGFTKPIREMVLLAFPELEEREGFLEQVIHDLDTRGLVDRKSRKKGEIVETTNRNLTDLGEEFLAFISEPPRVIQDD